MEDILEQREKRIAFQEELIKKYNLPLVFLRVNYPGLNKINHITRSIIESASLDFSRVFKTKIHTKLYEETLEGPNYTELIQCDEYIIKSKAIEFEELNPLGRLVDIDVYSSKDFKNISRVDLEMPPRKCYLCSKDAFICMREKNHSNEEIINFINDTYNDYLNGR
ncbi:MAG: citrate lyase holo-[acyl-carrier protein] synthase [Oscillospiraceae bacterium]|nr:citrate lyase holo-[acyl-carrier protein] synthase [Oscillospiraceae bacterium]